jgi:uncharacterized iron-regulated membrane protein
MAVFLTVAGVTGSLLAFYTDLDAALNPELLRAQPPVPGAPLLDPLLLREKLLEQLPAGTAVQGVMLRMKPDRSVSYWIDERENFVDPYTGALLGSRKFGDLSEGKKNLMTFLYEFHFSLALGEVGTVLFGVVAVLWTFDCFVGAYLTLPPQRARQAGAARKSWFSRWLPAWLLKTNKLFTLVFTWHRASGLWVWGFLLVFAWSGVALNLRQVYTPVMDALLGQPPPHETEHLPTEKPEPKLGMRQALAIGRTLMAAEAKHHGFGIHSESGLYYEPEHGAYMYSVDSTLDVDTRLGETTVTFDGDDGHLLLFAAAGSSTRGTIDQWLIGLHFGAIRIGGIAYRSFVSVLGLGVALLSITGVWIWLRKRGKKPVDKSLGPSRPAARA